VGGRTLIRMNEIKLEKIGITNPEHRCSKKKIFGDGGGGERVGWGGGS
jgi:hypothetical protein